MLIVVGSTALDTRSFLSAGDGPAATAGKHRLLIKVDRLDRVISQISKRHPKPVARKPLGAAGLRAALASSAASRSRQLPSRVPGRSWRGRAVGWLSKRRSPGVSPPELTEPWLREAARAGGEGTSRATRAAPERSTSSGSAGTCPRVDPDV